MITLLPFIPFATAALVLFISKKNETLLKNLTLSACGICSAITLYLFLNFEAGLTGYQFVQSYDWIQAFGIKYQVGLDGINMTFCLLHALVSFAGAFISAKPKVRLKEYLFYYLILTGAIYGVFTSLNVFFLYVFYETTLIPLFPMIGIWGSKATKEYGAMKLTIYITAGAVMGLFGILALYHQMGPVALDLVAYKPILLANGLDMSFQKAIAPMFMIGFGIMASIWPLHSWSPIGYAAAPTSVSMLHAGVLKKMGPYLIIRLAIGFLPEGYQHWAPVMAVLAGIGIIYAAFAALWQKDLKFMAGFSSVSHMGYILLGMAVMNVTSLSGAVLLMFSHGVMAACMFALIGHLYEQAHVRGIHDFGGLAKKLPFFSVCFMMTSMASLGLPGFVNFPAELLVFIGSWAKHPVIVGFAVFGILLTAIYLLRAAQAVCFGPFNEKWKELKDITTFTEKIPYLILLGALLLFGFWPLGLLRMIQPAVEVLLS